MEEENEKEVEEENGKGGEEKNGEEENENGGEKKGRKWRRVGRRRRKRRRRCREWGIRRYANPRTVTQPKIIPGDSSYHWPMPCAVCKRSYRNNSMALLPLSVLPDLINSAGLISDTGL